MVEARFVSQRLGGVLDGVRVNDGGRRVLVALPVPGVRAECVCDGRVEDRLVAARLANLLGHCCGQVSTLPRKR